MPNHKYKGSSCFLYAGPRLGSEDELKRQKILIPTPLSDFDLDYIPSTMPGPGHYYNHKKDTCFLKQENDHKYQLFNNSNPR